MRERYLLWTGARLLVAAAIVAWAVSYLGTGSGEKDFQKTLDAMKQVHSFRVASSANPNSNLHNELLVEVDCDHDILHRHWKVVQSNVNPPSVMDQDNTYVAGKAYDHKSDGTWLPAQYSSAGQSAKGYCNMLAQGSDSYLLPEISTMIRRGIIQKGDKKTVNGVRCREYLVTIRGGTHGLEHDTLCVGVDDHLPYEMTTDWDNSRSSYSDYNTPIRIDLPEPSVQPASANTSSASQ